MQAVKSGSPAAPISPTNKSISYALILFILIGLALVINDVYRASQPESLPKNTITISQTVLEEKYGLHINLIAVTGAGGFVDVRLKMTDADKAKLLLADAKNFPALFTEKGITLKAPNDTKSQKIEFVPGGNLFIMFSNAGNAVQRGKQVTIMFGDTAVESITVR